MSKVELKYWNIKGLAESIRFQMAFSGVEYTEVNPESREAWGEEKAKLISEGYNFANIPMIKDGDFILSETLAIHQYLAQKYDKKLLGKTVEEKAKSFQMALIVKFAELKLIQTIFSKADSPAEEMIETIKTCENTAGLLDQMNKHFQINMWLADKHITWADFYFYTFMARLIAFCGEDFILNGRDSLKTFVSNFRRVKGHRAFTESRKGVVHLPLPQMSHIM